MSFYDAIVHCTGNCFVFLVSYFLLWKSVEGQTSPQLDTNPVNVQDLRENVTLTFKYAFESKFLLRKIVIIQGNVR